MKKNDTLFSVRTFRAGALSEQIREHDLQAITVLSERRRDAHPRMRPCFLQICVFMSSVFTKGCALTFSRGVFVHKYA